MTPNLRFMRFSRIQTALLISFISFCVFNITSADAKSRPAYCPTLHDHRVHDADYYSYYPRAGTAYKKHKKTSRHYHYGHDHKKHQYKNQHKNRDHYYKDKGHNYKSHYNGYKKRPNRIVSRTALDTRYRARIIVQEEIVYGKKRKRLICTVKTRGPEAAYIPYRRLKRVAYNYCSPRARVSIYA